MISDKDWDKVIDEVDTNFGKKTRVICTDGTSFEGVSEGYCEDDEPNGNACWTILIGWRKFFQKDVECVEFPEE